ncbi:low-density lipoprotein receptor class A domain-containing protein 3-like isoform X2 [Clytia hemisphaerica]|uniref:Uncharacterized protein n=1 Tax=Clytia hemisphaerica TaxID=252671 RepID=A0A7M5V5J4_9CNID
MKSAAFIFCFLSVSVLFKPAKSACSIPGWFDCKLNGKCIPKHWRCDDYNDCRNNLDEQDCPFKCKSGQLKCSTEDRCFTRNQICDGINQCTDGSDETTCPFIIRQCPNSTNFECKNGKNCIVKEWKCDGEKDCVDGSDEENCK